MLLTISYKFNSQCSHSYLKFSNHSVAASDTSSGCLSKTFSSQSIKYYVNYDAYKYVQRVAME